MKTFMWLLNLPRGYGVARGLLSLRPQFHPSDCRLSLPNLSLSQPLPPRLLVRLLSREGLDGLARCRRLCPLLLLNGPCLPSAPLFTLLPRFSYSSFFWITRMYFPAIQFHCYLYPHCTTTLHSHRYRHLRHPTPFPVVCKDSLCISFLLSISYLHTLLSSLCTIEPVFVRGERLSPRLMAHTRLVTLRDCHLT